jgi:SAM-dependent MidA family methyltransferase
MTMQPTPTPEPQPLPGADAGEAPMLEHLRQSIAAHGGWIAFDDFMAQALYVPGLGYYARGATVFGVMPQGMRNDAGDFTGAGSDFVTAPEMTPLFGQALARQVAQALQATGTDEIWEFGAGTGALALQVLDALDTLGVAVRRYTIVDLSQPLKERQQATLRAHATRVRWVDALPETMQGVVLGNEVLDAMPVKLLARVKGVWHERGVVWSAQDGAQAHLAWQDRPTDLRPPDDVPGEHDYVTEIHPQGEAFVRTLADRLQAGAVFLLDYGFPEREYYHEQRHMGTVMCHRAHQADGDPLVHVGGKDITAHVNFTGIAVAAQDAGLEVLGYTSQAHFLMNCGLVDAMQGASLADRVAAQKLILEHEMGEFFKVIGLTKGAYWDAMGFVHGDRTHRL